MKTQYSVVIRKEHCLGREYKNCIGCPLFAAIKEQLPEFRLRSIGGDYVADLCSVEWGFVANYTNGWNFETMDLLLSDEITEHVVTFTHPDHKEKPIYENISHDLALTKINEIGETPDTKIKIVEPIKN